MSGGNHKMKFNESRMKPAAIFSLAWLLLIGLTTLSGCDSKTKEEPGEEKSQPAAIREVTIDLLVVGDEKLGPVIKRQFSSRRNGVANVTEISWDDFVAGDCQATSENDLVIFPARRLGELASRELIVPITEDNSRLDEQESRAFLHADRELGVSWAGQQVAMSLGQTHWVMLYRQDVLESVGAKPPENWKDFDKLAEQVAALESTELPKRIAIPLADHWAGYSLLCRAASAIRLPGKYSSYFDVGSMQPLIDSPPVLASLQGWSKQVGKQPSVQTPEQIIADYGSGKIAVAMVPLSHHLMSGETSMPLTTIGSIPGWSSVYDGSRGEWTDQLPGAKLSVPLTATSGMLVSCSANSNQQRNAIETMIWMTSKQMSSIISVESANAGLSRKSHLGNPGKWLGEQWNSSQLTQFADVLTEASEGRRVLTLLRIPQSDRYLDLLDNTVREVMLQDKNAVEALASLGLKWSEMTNEIGLESQKKAYRRSEGLEQ